MPKNIAIVDDSRTMREMLRDVLVGASYTVIECFNGEDAMVKMQGQKIELIITDYNMPLCGGMELIKKLRGKPEFKFTPVVMLTSENTESKKADGMSAGVSGWIVKPFEPGKLLQIVKRLVP